MKDGAYLHWHLHFDGSKYDGLITADEAEEDMLEYDKPCYAITDHGTINAVIQLHDKCKKHKKKFVPGSEIYVVNDKNEKLDGPRRKKFDKKRHLVLLAMNKKGFDNIIYLNTLANMHFFSKPRVDHDDVFDHNEGVIVTTACLGGVIASPLLWDDEADQKLRIKNATEIAFRYREAFGDRFYLELQPVEKEEQLILNRFLIWLHKTHGFQIIATNDAHYAKKEQYIYHARLIALQNRNSDEGGELIYKPGHHLRNLYEMRDAFKANGIYEYASNEVEGALETANTLHERFEGVVLDKKLKIPEYKEIQ